MDHGGFETYAQKVGGFIATNIFPDIPCLLAVDHSLSGGAFKKLVELYERKTFFNCLGHPHRCHPHVRYGWDDPI